jgi:two-component system NarL family sensor kinase
MNTPVSKHFVWSGVVCLVVGSLAVLVQWFVTPVDASLDTSDLVARVADHHQAMGWALALDLPILLVFPAVLYAGHLARACTSAFAGVATAVCFLPMLGGVLLLGVDALVYEAGTQPDRAAGGAVVALLVAAVPHDDGFTIVLAVLAVALLAVPVVGAAAVRAAPRNPVSWLLLASGTFLPVAIAAYCYGRATFDDGHDLPLARLAGWLDGWPWVPAMLLVQTFGILLFPDGRLPSRRWRALWVLQLVLAMVLTAGLLLGDSLLDWPDVDNPTGLPGAGGEVLGDLVIVILLVAPLITASAIALARRLRTADEETAAVIRLVLPAVWLMVASWWGCWVVGIAGRGTINALPVEAVGLLALGLTCWVAIRRYGLFDARLVVRRGLVYAALTVLVAVVYATVAALLTGLGASHVAAPVAAALAILVAIPLRDRLQRLANRLVFGLRDDPFATFVRLGDQLENAAAADEVLAAAVRSVRDTLRLQHVAIRHDDEVLAEAGTPGSRAAEEVPLVYSGERVGTLLVEPAESDVTLRTSAAGLLTGIAGPIAAAVRATALSRDLAGSRERLVAATEEERRRLRRDLHDGLGPALSSTVLGLSRARDLVSRDPAAAVEQLGQLTAQVQDAVTDVRRLVYGLRPPALDELGLVGALDEQAQGLGPIRVTGPRESVPLSAAVEVAAYRIAMEAMTNAARHAHPREVVVDVAVDGPPGGALRLEIADDGVGLPDGYRAGVGITSMRERAAELGGSCTVERRSPRGTLVRAVMPLEPV